MLYGIIIVVVLMTLVAYVVLQETRAQMHWRGLVAQGDVEAIRQLVQAEVDRWRTERVPKGVPALLWHGVQTVELIEVSAKGCRVNCGAEGEYSLAGGRRVETSSPLAEGMKITQKLADMLLYEVPNLRLEFVQIDVYTAFRDEHGRAEPRCILSTVVRRGDIEDLDWEATPAQDFIALTGGRYAAEAGGVAAIEPFDWAEQAA